MGAKIDLIIQTLPASVLTNDKASFIYGMREALSLAQVTVWNLLLAQTHTFRHDAHVICDFPALRSRNVAGHARVASCSVSAITTDPIFLKTGPIF